MTANSKRAAAVRSKVGLAVSAVLLLGCGHREELHWAKAVWSDDDSEWLVMVQHTEYTESLGDSSYDYDNVRELWRVPAGPVGESIPIRSGKLVKRWEFEDDGFTRGSYLGFFRSAGVIFYGRHDGRFVRHEIADGSEVVELIGGSPIPSPDGKFLAYVGAEYSYLDRDTYDVGVIFRDGETFEEFPLLRVMMKLTDKPPSARDPLGPYKVWLDGKLYVAGERLVAAFTPPDKIEYPVEPPCFHDKAGPAPPTSTSHLSRTGLVVTAHAETETVGAYQSDDVGYPDWCTAQK